MTDESPISTEKTDANPGAGVPKTRMLASDPALRLAIGRYTVDVVDDPDADAYLALVGAGVGHEFEPVAVDVGAVAALVTVADRVEQEIVWQTAAWPRAVA